MRGRFSAVPIGFVAVLAALSLAQAAEPARTTRPVGLSVSVEAARKMCFEDRVEVTGTLVPRQSVDISPDREGLQVTQVLVEPLDQVTPGQVLARLAPAEGQPGSPSSVRSTVAGLVGRSTAVVGAPASSRQALFQIIVGGDLDVEAELPVGQLAKLSVGQPVTVRPLGLADLSGSVQAIGASLDPSSQLGRIRIAVSNGADLRVGTFARGLIAVDRRCGIGVPYSSVMYDSDATIVQVVVGERVEARQVTVGLISGSYAEIRSGLTEAATVVTRAGPFLRDGEAVTPILVGESGQAAGPRKP